MSEVLDLFRLDGKNALVTGASRGLGAAMAVALAQAGANVALHGSREVPQPVQERIRAAGRKAAVVIGDLQDVQTAPRLVEEAVGALGSIDILINNAGMIRRAPAAEYPMADWASVLQTNLTSVFQLCQAAGARMLAQGSGKIINIASLLTFQGGVFVPAYSAAKGAVGQLTKALANEWSSKGINVNAIAPGYMATDNTEALRNDEVRSRQILERIPAGRWGAADDLAGAAIFLASRASDYVHGHVLVVDGGWLAR
ncbi:MAG: 2-dehydro-3-deoxy-D-gluconate 5-dehydrogenase KduD [Acidobacteriota bacterium]